MHTLAQRLLAHVRQQELLPAGDRVGVAVSGGIDSVALLRLLLELRSELGIVVAVVHFNHKLRGAESDADQEFVEHLTQAHKLEFFAGEDDVASHAREEGISAETAARELRYGYFRHLLGEDEDPRLTKICTGHTLDDQAETVLMRMIRGAGVTGLGGIYPRILADAGAENSGEIVRPVLGIRRRELECYLRDIGQDWREDSSNADTSLTRNRVRHLVVPLLEKEFNPAIAESLSELADIARGEEEYWENEVSGWMGTAVHWAEPEWLRAMTATSSLVQIGPAGKPSLSQGPDSQGSDGSRLADLQSRTASVPWLVMNASVSRVWFLAEPLAVQRRVIRAIGEHAGLALEFKHVEEIVYFAAESGDSGKQLSLPSGWKVLREAEDLVFVTPDLRAPAPPADYEYDLSIPGSIFVPETGSHFDALFVPANRQAGYNPEQLLDPDSIQGPLKVRNWRPGDRFWPPHTKSPKKIKELLQERRIPHPERRLWPAVAGSTEIIWLRGFPVPAQHRVKPERGALLLRERAAKAKDL